MKEIEETAGRLQITPGGIPTAHISPLANPLAFAKAHGLQVEAYRTAWVDDDPSNPTIARVVMLSERHERFASYSGFVSLTHDDHAATTVDMLDFTDRATAQVDWNIACDVVFARFETGKAAA